MNSKLVAFFILLANQSNAFAGNPASQSWVKTYVESLISAGNIASQSWVKSYVAPTINWQSLCRDGQSLTDSDGCTPNCNTSPAASTCTEIFKASQIEQLSTIPSPYLSNGIVVFKLTQTGGGSNAIFNVTVNQIPSGYGYSCEILNADGTVVNLWDTQNLPPAYPINMINMDNNLMGAPPTVYSDKFVNFISQPISNGVGYWYNNPKNPLYMMCLGYEETGINSLKSHASCGGTVGPTCVSYLLA